MNAPSCGVYFFFRKRVLWWVSLAAMSRPSRNKHSLTDKIDSNRVDDNEPVGKKRRHLSIKSDDDTSNSNWKPPYWEKTLQNIREMRKDVVAPVDDMGCDQAADMNESPEVCSHTRISYGT